MDFRERTEKILRNRYFLVIVVPLLIALTSVILDLRGDWDFFFSLEIFGMFGLYLFFGFLRFPSLVLYGLVGPEFDIPSAIHILFEIPIFGLYLWYILRVKLVSRRTLYICTLIILFVAVLGIRGCGLLPTHM